MSAVDGLKVGISSINHGKMHYLYTSSVSKYLKF